MKILIGLGCLGLSVISYLINKSAFKGDEKNFHLKIDMIGIVLILFVVGISLTLYGVFE